MPHAAFMPAPLVLRVDRSESTTEGLTRAKVEEFRQLLERECGLQLELDEAWHRATKLVALYRMLMGPIPEDPAIRTSANLPFGPGDARAVVE